MATAATQKRFARARDLQKKLHKDEDKVIAQFDSSEDAKKKSRKVVRQLKTAQGLKRLNRRFVRQRDSPAQILKEMTEAIQELYKTLRFGMEGSRIFPDMHYLLPMKHDDFPGWAYMVDSFGSRYYMEVEYKDGKPVRTIGEPIISRTNNTAVIDAMNLEKAEHEGQPSAIIGND